jgi:beta-glucosidase
MKISRRFLLASTGALVATSALAKQTVTYRNVAAPIPLRVKDLLGRMTIDEKVAQLSCIWFTKGKVIDLKTGAFSEEKASQSIPNGIGHMGRPSDTAGLSWAQFSDNAFREPADAIEFTNAVQRFSVEKTRLGIPVLFHEETAHGLAVKGATSFPIPPGLGSTWDPDLIEDVFTYVARQARGRGVAVGLSPVLDLIRDPRWGRCEEFFGEDPYLVGEMGAAAVRGLQGRTRPIGPDRVLATLKHFIHGTPQNGLNTSPSDMSERALREYFLPPFQKAVRNNAAIIMPSYNELGGVPSHGNHALLQNLGRDLLGFKGAYISDYGGVEELANKHHMASDLQGAGILAIKAGVDVNLPEGEAYSKLAQAVKDGLLPESYIDTSVSRVLALKFEAGLFERPYVDPIKAADLLTDPAGPQLALKTAHKAMVLLKNDGILPLDPAKPLKLALIGPDSVDPLLGGYSGRPTNAIGVLAGLKAVAGKDIVIEQADGVWITQPDAKGRRQPYAPMKAVPKADNDKRIDEAVQVASRSDVVVLVVGDNEQVTREAVSAAAAGDRNSLSLYGDQDRLVDAILATGKPVVTVLINGRPLAINPLAAKANAIVEAWYAGEQGGTAIADVLFGNVNPGGKLTVSFARSVGELPAFYNRHPSTDMVPYVEGKRTALFPFGHGLSYTQFDISAPRLVKSQITKDQPFTVEVDVSNTGDRAGDEVVQIYIRDTVSSVPRPIIELKAFRRVTLKPGERQTLTFELQPDDLAFWDIDMKWSVEPGEFRISAGSSSAKLQHVILNVA